ncbi:hypothetical protein [Rhizorhabdus argentea]
MTLKMRALMGIWRLGAVHVPLCTAGSATDLMKQREDILLAPIRTE